MHSSHVIQKGKHTLYTFCTSLFHFTVYASLSVLGHRLDCLFMWTCVCVRMWVLELQCVLYHGLLNQSLLFMEHYLFLCVLTTANSASLYNLICTRLNKFLRVVGLKISAFIISLE